MNNFCIMQQSNGNLLTAIASDGLFEAMAVSRSLWVYSLMINRLKHFYSMYLGKGLIPGAS